MLPPDLVLSTLTGLDVDEQTVQTIMTILKDGYDGIEGTPVDETSSTGFGPSPQGGVLSYNTGRARAHVVEAMDNLVIGLQEYRKGMQTWHTNIKNADHDSAVTLTRLQNGSGCADPSVQTPSCTVPAGDS